MPHIINQDQEIIANFDTEQEAQEYMQNNCNIAGLQVKEKKEYPPELLEAFVALNNAIYDELEVRKNKLEC